MREGGREARREKETRQNLGDPQPCVPAPALKFFKTVPPLSHHACIRDGEKDKYRFKEMEGAHTRERASKQETDTEGESETERERKRERTRATERQNKSEGRGVVIDVKVNLRSSAPRKRRCTVCLSISLFRVCSCFDWIFRSLCEEMQRGSMLSSRLTSSRIR